MLLVHRPHIDSMVLPFVDGHRQNNYRVILLKDHVRSLRKMYDDTLRETHLY